MTGWVIYDRKQYDQNKWFADELARYCSAFSAVKLIIAEKLKFGICDNSISFYYEGVPLKIPGYAIVRTIYPLLSFALEESGVRIFNRYAISQVCNDKRLTYLIASGSRVPIMQTAMYDRRFFDSGVLEAAEYPCVLKSAMGHGGKEVFLAESADEMRQCLSQIPSNEFLLQKRCDTVGKDLRVYLLGGEIIGAVLRSSSCFKSNYSLGGSVERYRLNAEEENSVYSVLECLPAPADFVGVDFLLDREGLIFNEIEDVVGSRMLYKTCGLNVACLFAKHVQRCVTCPEQTKAAQRPESLP